MLKFRARFRAIALPALLTGLTVTGASPQPMAASAPASAAEAAAKGNKAGKPPVDAAASQAGVATRKPAKAGAQSGPVPASAPER